MLFRSIPYPPGFPILVPGQVISSGILAFMRALDVNEIHGYRADLGLRVFTPEALAALMPQKQLTTTKKIAASKNANKTAAE